MLGKGTALCSSLTSSIVWGWGAPRLLVGAWTPVRGGAAVQRAVSTVGWWWRWCEKIRVLGVQDVDCLGLYLQGRGLHPGGAVEWVPAFSRGE